MEDFARHLDAVTHGDGVCRLTPSPSPPPCVQRSRFLVGDRDPAGAFGVVRVARQDVLGAPSPLRAQAARHPAGLRAGRERAPEALCGSNVVGTRPRCVTVVLQSMIGATPLFTEACLCPFQASV